ncbi:MAG: prepilin-type N-terminal cleavage/methylation domain-containing protein [Candidatus Komeilibacteria bacterium]
MLNFNHHHRGFTLLEGIIAMAVITIGLVAGITLTVVNISSAQNNERRIVAANLAREGIEAIRNMRDSNWLKVNLNESYTTTGGGTKLYTWNSWLTTDASGVKTPVPNAFTITYLPAATSGSNPEYNLIDNVIGEGCGRQDYMCGCYEHNKTSCAVTYDSATQLYGTASGNPSSYYRIITLQDICYQDSSNSEVIVIPEEGCDTGNNYFPVGVVVTSQVRYPAGQSTQDVIARERLYNWR